MALHISISGDDGGGKSAVGTLIEELLVQHGFMVIADIDAPRSIELASQAAQSVSKQDPRVILNEVHTEATSND